MQITLTPEEIAAAPAAVHQWLTQIMGVPPAKPKTRKKKDPPAEVAEEAPAEIEEAEPPKHSDVLSAAGKFVESKGEEDLVAIFADLGLKKLSDCKPEQRAELLTRMATA